MMKASLDCFGNCMLFCDLYSVVVQGVTIDDDYVEEHLLLSGSYKRHINERGSVENSPLQSFKVGHALENNCRMPFYRCWQQQKLALIPRSPKLLLHTRLWSLKLSIIMAILIICVYMGFVFMERNSMGTSQVPNNKWPSRPWVTRDMCGDNGYSFVSKTSVLSYVKMELEIYWRLWRLPF
jgi:hypothetical protein